MTNTLGMGLNLRRGKHGETGNEGTTRNPCDASVLVVISAGAK